MQPEGFSIFLPSERLLSESLDPGSLPAAEMPESLAPGKAELRNCGIAELRNCGIAELRNPSGQPAPLTLRGKGA